MKRRNFIKNLSSLAGAAPFVLNGLPMQAFAANSELQRAAANSTNDRVIVLIQLHGGNDGLNTIIPINQYSEYYNLRANIAIPESGNRKMIQLDSFLPDEQQVGLHPDMQDFKWLYDQGKAAVVQNVAYENINGSHFRSRDIWFMGGDYDDHYGSGWIGRYLNHYDPAYPEGYPSEQNPDPLALEIGNDMSLAFHRDSGIPVSISINNPEQFYNLITNVGGAPPESVKDTFYGHELQWIMDLEEKSNQYAGRLKELFDKGRNSSTVYPERYPLSAPDGDVRNPLSAQLRMIARLLSGGAQTKIFLAKIGGFDTHANQVEDYDATMGGHAAKLYHITSAVRAFQDDLKALGLEDKVLTVTFSEFGRRAISNGSYGTDHGKAAPMMIFGKNVHPGVVGNTPDLKNLDRGDIRYEIDYRQVFTTLLEDWMGATPEAIQDTRFEDFSDKKLPLIAGSSTVTSIKDDFINERYRLDNCYPNPARNKTIFSYRINANMHVSLNLYDMNGQLVKRIVDEVQKPGTYQYPVTLYNVPAGTYIYRIEAGLLKAAKRLIIAK
ncbi:DUF1501 domain-containing protein [Limibacter armeniacum]|uniref:DUF1501 domain-containing protein n=1 Tax=Limibacter armeniacum TaxID=466084 RepID=UPI002FE60E13